MLANPAAFIESESFFSWEQFFTHELIEKTQGTYLAYDKSKLSSAYLDDHVSKKIEGRRPQLGL